MAINQPITRIFNGSWWKWSELWRIRTILTCKNHRDSLTGTAGGVLTLDGRAEGCRWLVDCLRNKWRVKCVSHFQGYLLLLQLSLFSENDVSRCRNSAILDVLLSNSLAVSSWTFSNIRLFIIYHRIGPEPTPYKLCFDGLILVKLLIASFWFLLLAVVWFVSLVDVYHIYDPDAFVITYTYSHQSCWKVIFLVQWYLVNISNENCSSLVAFQQPKKWRLQHYQQPKNQIYLFFCFTIWIFFKSIRLQGREFLGKMGFVQYGHLAVIFKLRNITSYLIWVSSTWKVLKTTWPSNWNA